MAGASAALAAGAIAAPVVGGIIGADQAQKDRHAASQARLLALAQFAGIELPEIEKMLYQLSGPEYAGDYQAALEAATEIGPSAYEGIQLDPRMAEAQMQALQQISELGEVGLTQGEKAAAMELQREAAAQGRAQQNAVMQEMARRGVAGGGQELAQRLASSQAAADRMSRHGNQLAQMAQARAMEAIAQKGNMAGQIRGQEFSEQARAAEAADRLAQWAAQNRAGVQQRNVGSTNQAALRNLQEKQRLGEQRTQLRNIEEQRRASLHGEQFDRELALASARAGIHGGQAGASDKYAKERAEMWAGIGSGVGQGLTALNKKPSATVKGSDTITV